MSNYPHIKILYTIPNFDTAGSGKALLKIASRLDKNIFEPHIACMHNRGEFFKIVKDSGIPVHILQFTTPMIPRFWGLKNCWKISRLFKKINPDIIHSFHYSADYSEPLSARMAGIKWVFTKKNMSWGGSSKNSWILRSKLANGIVVQNTDMVKKFYPNSQKTKLIPRGVDTNEFKSIGKNSNILNEFDCSEKTFVIMTVANLVPVKGIEILIKAFEIIEKNVKNAKLIIVGEDSTEYAVKLKKMVTVNNFSEKIIFTGKRLDISNLLSIADVFVLPTLSKGRQEGSPVSLLEAMASGVPVFASDVPGIRDQLQDLPEQMFPPNDYDFLSNKIIKFIRLSEDEKEKIIAQQNVIIMKKYTIEKEVLSHEEFYKKVVKLK